MTFTFTRTAPLVGQVLYPDEAPLKLCGTPIDASVIWHGIAEPGNVLLNYNPSHFRLDAGLEVLLDPFIEHLSRQNQGKQMFDGETVRLKDIHIDGSRLTLFLQPARYFQYLLTNWAAAQNYTASTSTGAHFSIRDLVEPGPALRALSDSPAANHLGIGVILECGGRILLSHRSSLQMTDAGMLGLSASGGLGHAGQETDPFAHALTEVHEELGLDETFMHGAQIFLIAIAREHQRAGKPEMYFLVRPSQSQESVGERILQRHGKDSWEAIGYSWFDPFDSDAWTGILASRALQPSARIGLWSYCQTSGTSAFQALTQGR